MQNIIEINNISFRYSGEAQLVLDDVTMSVEKGEFVAIIGANGSGKTTLAKHMNAILTPAEGTVRVNGMDTGDDAHLYDIRSTVGMVFQNPDNQIVASVVEEDVAFALENLGVPRAEMRRRIDEAMETAGVFHLRESSPHKLSGGQKQRVAIAGVLAMSPACIVLDEPTAMLDPVGRAKVMRTIKALNRDRGMTVVLITHFMEDAARADRVIAMSAGQIAMQGTPQEIFSDIESLHAIGLDAPPVTELCALLRQSGLDLPADIVTPDTCVASLDALLKSADIGDGDPVVPRRADPAAEKNDPDVPQNNIIETKDLIYTYSKGMPDEKTAVGGISVAVEKGEFLGIIGHTGSGKSTFIQHLNGLLKPTSGQVLIDGGDMWANKDKLREYRFKVGLVFQYPEYQLFEETVYKDIAFGPRNMGLPEEEIQARVARAAGYVGLTEEQLQRSPFDLSGGQKRRAAIAGVLAMEPEVLILDEPTAGLDPAGRAEILDEIERYHRERGNTVMIVSHSMDDIARYAKRVMVINEGRLFCYDDAARVFSMADELEAMGLAIPSVTGVLLRLREMGHDVYAGVYTVEDAARSILAAMGKEGGARA